MTLAPPRATTLGEAVRRIRARFRAAGVATPELDARLLVSAILGYSATNMILRDQQPVAEEAACRLEQAVARRIGGEPAYRIIGTRPFYGLELRLSPATLEPRPDTETLVEAVAPFVLARAAERGRCRIADMGTGTGAIGLALLTLSRDAHCTGVDISPAALATAAENARRNGLADRFDTVESDWFEKIAGRFDAIVANPPYIKTSAIATLAREVRDHDPRLALDGGEDGLGPYRVLAQQSAGHLEENGLVAVEYGFDQAEAVESIFRLEGLALVSRHKDLSGHDRVSLFASEAS